MVDERDFNVDAAEEYDDGTRAVTYDDEENDALLRSDSEEETVKLSSSRKQRLQKQSKKSGTAERASTLRVQNWDVEMMESAEYSGKVVKRKDVAMGEGMDSPDEDAMADWSDAEPFGASDDEEDEEEDDDEASDIASDDSEGDDDDDDEETDGKDTEKLLRGFQKEDSAQLMNAKDSAKLVEKATHVRNQKLIWERCLEIQIYTKRLLGSTKLVANSEDKTQSTSAIDQLYACIDTVSKLQDTLCNSEALSVDRGDDEDDESSKKRKRTVDDVWTTIHTKNQETLPQYNDILNASTRKTNLAGGNQAKKFKAVNQDILAQVESVLADPQRVKRKAHAPADPDANGHTTGEEEEGGDNGDELDELMYDDSDFYQQLLKEFIESGGGGNGADALIRRTHRKKKKMVNRKASKGRVVRYNVHPKLENFMFPEPYPRSEMDVDELFRSVFGGRRAA